MYKTFETYKLIKNGDHYKIINFSLDEKINFNVKKEETNKNKINKKIIYKNVNKYFVFLKKFFELNNKFNTFFKKTVDWFRVNKFKFNSIKNVYNFLFKNKKSISGFDIIKLKKLFKIIIQKQYKMLCKNAKLILKI